jgi:hypothetical protein
LPMSPVVVNQTRLRSRTARSAGATRDLRNRAPISSARSDEWHERASWFSPTALGKQRRYQRPASRSGMSLFRHPIQEGKRTIIVRRSESSIQESADPGSRDQLGGGMHPASLVNRSKPPASPGRDTLSILPDPLAHYPKLNPTRVR